MLMLKATEEPPLSRLPQPSLTRARMSHCTARALILTFSSGKRYLVQSYGGDKRRDGQTHTLLFAVVIRVLIQDGARV